MKRGPDFPRASGNGRYCIDQITLTLRLGFSKKILPKDGRKVQAFHPICYHLSDEHARIEKLYIIFLGNLSVHCNAQ